MANENMKLPSRSYWEGFKARNEALWDKVKNNTFVNMVFPIKEVSEGNTEAMLPLVVPGGNVVRTTAQLFKPGLTYRLGADMIKYTKDTRGPVSYFDAYIKIPKIRLKIAEKFSKLLGKEIQAGEEGLYYIMDDSFALRVGPHVNPLLQQGNEFMFDLGRGYNFTEPELIQIVKETQSGKTLEDAVSVILSRQSKTNALRHNAPVYYVEIPRNPYVNSEGKSVWEELNKFPTRQSIKEEELLRLAGFLGNPFKNGGSINYLKFFK